MLHNFMLSAIHCLAVSEIPVEFKLKTGFSNPEAPRRMCDGSPIPLDARLNLEVEQHSFWQCRIQREDMKTALAALRSTSSTVYNGRWQAFVKWCIETSLIQTEVLSTSRLLEDWQLIRVKGP